MRQSRDLIGKPIVAADSGQKLGTVADLLLDESRGSMVGIVIGGGVFGSERVLPYGDVQTVGPDVIVARSENGVLDARGWHDRGTHATRTSAIVNRRVVTKDGRDVGAVSDLYVDEKTGALTGYDIAGRGLMPRHSVLLQSPDVTIGRDVILVPEEVAQAGDGGRRGASPEDAMSTGQRGPHEYSSFWRGGRE